MNKGIFDFYLVSNDTKIHMFKGTFNDFEKVEQLYGELWFKVIDNQLNLIDFDNGYDISKLTSDPILRNWEGSDIEARQIGNIYHYLGDSNWASMPNS
jgi:hypothetical protein